MKKLLLSLIMIFTFAPAVYAVSYEYKIVPLGSLTSIQKGKEKDKAARTQQLEEILNKYGKDGWDISEIFAVRTTFDPNVFFVIIKRPLN